MHDVVLQANTAGLRPPGEVTDAQQCIEMDSGGVPCSSQCVVLSCNLPWHRLQLWWWHTQKQQGTQHACSPEAQSP